MMRTRSGAFFEFIPHSMRVFWSLRSDKRVKERRNREINDVNLNKNDWINNGTLIKR